MFFSLMISEVYFSTEIDSMDWWTFNMDQGLHERVSLRSDYTTGHQLCRLIFLTAHNCMQYYVYLHILFLDKRALSQKIPVLYLPCI